MSSEDYVEENSLTIPVLKDGVTRLGDLWDCHQSKYVGENLFDRNLDGKYINASPIEFFDYRLIHSNSSSDRIKIINVSGEVSLEMLAGLLTAKGSVEFDKKDVTTREQIICHYQKETFSVNASTDCKEILNQSVIEKLMKNKLKATHFVRRITLGAEVESNIIVTKNISNYKGDLKGNLLGKLVYGNVNALVKSKLKLFDSEDNKNFNREINIHSIPAMKSEPKTVKEMFQMIESIDAVVEKQKHFPESGDHIIGVPIRFVLVPIKQFLDVKIEKSYLKLSEKVLNDFNEMLIKVQDIQIPGYILKKVLKANRYLSILINDSQSKLTQNIKEYESYLKNTGIKFFEDSTKAIKHYKLKNSGVEDLLEILNRFGIELDSSEELKKIAQFVEQGEVDLASISSVDIKDSLSSIQIFSNKKSLDQFIIGDKECKMWLCTDFKAPVGVFSKIDEMAENLNKNDFKIGIAVKSISSKFELFVKVNREKYSCDKEDEIPFILSIIGATVGVGLENELLFFSMNAEILNIKLPFESKQEMFDITNLIRKLRNLSKITITRSRLETFDLLTRNDNKFKFFMPIDAKHTSFLAIKKLQNLKPSFKDVDWIVGNLDIPQILATGYLFIIKNSKVVAVCLDEYDLKFLKEKCCKLSEKSLKFLSPENMKNSFYPDRAISSEKIIKTIEMHQYKRLDISEYGLLSFEEEKDENLINALELACSVQSNIETDSIATIAKFSLRENEELYTILSKAGYSLTDLKFQNNILSEENKIYIKNNIQALLAKSNSLIPKILFAIQVCKEAIDFNEKDISVFESKVDKALELIITDKNCKEDLKEKIKAKKFIDLKSRCAEIKLELEKFENEEEKSEKFFHTKKLYSVLINEKNTDFCDVLKKYITRIKNNKIIESKKQKFFKELKQKHFNKLIASLAELSHGVKYHIVRKGLKTYSKFEDKSKAPAEFLNKFANDCLFDGKNFRDLWKNNRFEYIIRSSIDNQGVLGKLYQMGCKLRVLDCIPQDIAQKLNKLREDGIDKSLFEKIENFEKFANLLREMRRKKKIKFKFRSILTDSINENPNLFEKLKKLEILELFKWDNKEKVFPEAIDMNKIIEAVDIIDKSEENDSDIRKPIDIEQFNIDFKNEKYNYQNKSSLNEKTKFSKVLEFIIETHEDLRPAFGESNKLINLKEFISLSMIIEKPHLLLDESNGIVAKVKPYIIQKIKMWGCQALSSDNISGLIASKEDFDEEIEENLNFFNRPLFGRQISNSSAQISKKDSKIPLSRLDIITCIFNSVDCIIGQDLLNIMAKFPISLPLIIKELHDKDSYKNLIPWLTQPVIKWESSPGKIVENHLFLDDYKMIVTLRIGNNEIGKCGKSTIINQILSAKNAFSCCGEPGADKGKSFTSDGTVEFIWLTQETSSNKLWESVLKNHYKKGVNELIILANLHGNSLEFEDNLKLLGEIATSFIVFMMPENNENSIESWNKLAKYLGLNPQSEKLSYVAIDPPPSHKDYYEKLIIHTSKIADDSNIAKLRSVLKNSLKLRGKQLNLKFLKNIGKVRVAELIETEESSRMIKHIREATCEKTKRNLSLQKGDKTHFQCSIAWKENEKLKELIELMGNILLLDTQERIKAMTHLEKELGIMSDQESGNARQEFLNALDDLQKLIGAKIEDQVFVQQKKFQVNKALKKMNNISLGLEHFYREIGKIYEIILAENPKNKIYENFAKKYAELVIAGQAIEILDGDSGSISGPWLTAICNNVYKQIPKMRIFVVSILGLQSSGKSTLLNALFGCKFAVSVGRCTKGLFIRLLFLDEIMKKKLNFDALLLIDTEGLGTPEKQNEADAERKDRLMATFAMSVSHLTIVNVLGEYMRDLTEILQIAIVALARLEKADISPDIIMVQHLTERNSEKLTSSIKQFGDALEKAINISDEKDVNLGVRNSKCLNTLRERIAIGKLFRQFRPFKNGASVYSPPSEEYHQDVVDLFKFIIDIAHESKFRSDFKQWRILVQSYWDSLKSENFMRFKDVKELQEFLQRGQIISKVKESIESSFREHTTLLRSFISEQAKKMNEKIVTQESIFSDLKFKLKFIPNTCPSQPACERCIQFNNNFEELLDFEDNKPSKHETELTLENFINGTRDWHFKQLSQMLSAIAFRQIESSEFHEKIEKRLRQRLNLKKKDFTDSDIESIAGKIWHDIEIEAAERVTQISVLAQIKKEMSEQQIYGPKFVHDFKNYRITSLKNIPAIKKTKIIEYDMFTTHGYTRNSKENEMLESQQIYELEGKISEISEIILNEENAQNFQTGMISKVINNVEQIISDFESHNGMKLKTEFKLKLHLLANQIFGETMNIKQLEWDKKYNPLTILQENKSQYYDVIIERLKHGFNFDSDGMIAGNCLLKAIKQKTEKELKTQKIDYILDTDWLINSESVRLKYFSELVEEIKKGNLKRALSHFEDPRANIESWFSEKVDKIPTDKVSNEYTDNLNSKIETVVQDIRKMTTIEETRNYIENYISSCNGINAPPKLVSKKADKTEIEIYKYGIIKVLRKADIVSEKNYFIPSKEKQVMDRLGCTRSCPVCSALCWGQRRHAINSGETRKHHTCHQPMGLSGTKYRGTDTLLCESCHDEKPSNGWFVGMKGEPMSWDSMIKSEKYNNWKYGAHVYSKFNDLMKWFFFKLHESIASNKKIKPATKQDLQLYGIDNLDIGSIMAAINDKI